MYTQSQVNNVQPTPKVHHVESTSRMVVADLTVASHSFCSAPSPCLACLQSALQLANSRVHNMAKKLDRVKDLEAREQLLLKSLPSAQ